MGKKAFCGWSNEKPIMKSINFTPDIQNVVAEKKMPNPPLKNKMIRLYTVRDFYYPVHSSYRQ